MFIFADLIAFGLKIDLSIILYIFVGVGVISFIIYLLNLLFRSTKKAQKINDADWIKKRDREKAQNDVDNEILSILKNRKEGDGKRV
ncbi:integral membrane protein (TIGR04561 family) [Entomoplasma freundtii]|uniref:Uncharacterized protein n=2 Tax=Entomoplasma freundtii TaxID=74700 RepID=A0A2K8NRG2_9MOLU|nr:hypothetical protein EFREU_v1c03830 [Entomoplasma freundtii]TDY56552.1 integral membrane protein (TIGR04561 family) [Entomoplasma freundtii]